MPKRKLKFEHMEFSKSLFFLASENLMRVAIGNTRQDACFAAVVRSSFNDAAWKEGLADIRECEDWVLFVDWVVGAQTQYIHDMHTPPSNYDIMPCKLPPLYK